MQPLQPDHFAARLPLNARYLHRRLRWADIVVTLFGLATSAAAQADGTGWYTPEQVAQGRWQYSKKCGGCHGQQLQGTGAPALRGTLFADQWIGKKLSDFYGYVHTNMPLGMGASLSTQEYADIVAFVLAQNGLPAGTDKLSPKSPMDRVLELDATAAAGGTVAAAAPDKIEIGKLYGTLAQRSEERRVGKECLE